ncbi:urea carboxylase-associated family protein [Pseudoclavibacter sp. CFCC 11306]|uniref:urea carboxylase-associated family protein n=1 Tax=Pseudoclavibacter sp. CFCC 11306 TaxID=1564493 RepID=UPI001300E513|nr:urea carboxylase-associated family protein [Pseudoclavibacter sp. CFCC 11306]KAB1659177.1 urea carboxylase-associated family protein [Pseudoclavibacter sp. CFCC 11306]
MAGTEAAYQAFPGGPLDVNRDFYDAVADESGRELADDFEIEVRSARAWPVNSGQVCRILQTDGPQVGDLNVWNRHDPRERLWAARTRQLQRATVTTYDHLWSTLPSLRPLLTFTADTLADHPEALVIHDLLGTRCDPYVNRMLSGYDFDYHCHSNLTRAVQPFGLTEYDVHDVLNVFQCAGLNDDTQYFMKDCPAREGDYLEFFAEIDLLCALSCCPGGDLSLAMWGPDAASTEEQLQHCHRLRVQVFDVDPGRLAGWAPPQPSRYRGQNGRHGLHATPFRQLPPDQQRGGA